MSVSILITSDLHGRVDRFKHLVNQMKALKPNLVIDNGDFLDGSPATYYYKHINKKPHPMIQQANEIYDVAIFGNHEFHNSLPAIQRMRSECSFPWISCNIGNFAEPYFIKVVDGKKIAIIGATTHYTAIWDEHGHLEDLVFEDAFKALNYWVDYVRRTENPDYLIVSYHGGFSEDPSNGTVFQERIGENQANEILEYIPNIDLLITGHQHLYINEKIRGTLIVQPTSHAKGFFEVLVDFDKKHSQATFHELQKNSLIYSTEIEDWLNQELTYIQENYSYKGLLTSRLSSHPFIQLIHDMQLKATNAQISVCDLLYFESGGVKGKITNRDVLKNFPREHKLKVISLSGEEIKQLLEQSAAIFALHENGEIDFSTNVFPDTYQPYQYDFWGGISYLIDVRKPVGQRVKNVTFQEKPLKNEQHYQIVFNSYRLTGYDFHLLKNRQIFSETIHTVPFLFKVYVQSNIPTNIPNHGNFRVIYK
ncbi:MAG TPA: bifunctional UDP-sugar hydrolase/5'-nucleotidase [Ureibacillus sp.]|nr:bifunctional UDP-sugar hydrolase/5'-nucleotidase [Ureibacillus sp.]